MKGTGSCGPMRIIFGSVIIIVGIEPKISNLMRIGRSMCPRCRYTGLVCMGGTSFCEPMANVSLVAKFEVRTSLHSDTSEITTGGRTDRHSSNVLEFHADQMSLRSQINIYI